MNEARHERLTTKHSRYSHIFPKKGNITVDSLSPVVIMKKIKLCPSDASGLGNVTDFLPELTDVEEEQELESQRVRAEGAANALPARNDDVSLIHSLSPEELNGHIQKCLELSSENKINSKNAFALQLIDCFSILQKKKDFAVMACTLDAGAKIYSCRVDALHQQVVRLADEVVTKNGEERKDKDGETLSKRGVTMEQRKTRKNSFIVSSESLTRKMKGKDPKDKYLRFEALPGAILSGARRDPSDLSLSLERYSPFWPNWDSYKPIKAKGMVSLPDIKIFREKSKTAISEGPPSFSEPDNHQTDTEHSVGDDNYSDHIFEETSPHSEEFVSIVDIPDIAPNTVNEGETHMPDDIEMNATSVSISEENEVDVVLTAMDRLQQEAEAEGAVNRAPTRMEALKLIFDLSSEYNYLSMKNCNYWAGPEFWKRPKELNNESVKIKRKVTNKNKEPAKIVYDFEDYEERLLTLSKKSTVLSEKTIRNWKTKKTTLPTDVKVELSWFLNLFNVDNCGGKSEEAECVQTDPSFVDVLDKYEGAEDVTDNFTDPFSPGQEDTSNSQDPLNATFYEAVSAQSADSDHRDPLNKTFYDAGPSNVESGQIIRVEVSSTKCSEFGESSMVPVPKMVNFNPIKYSTRPIRVDMQHLKHAMLEVIREEVERDAREKMETASNSRASWKPEVKFRDVLRGLPKKLERRTREDLSTALAFTALLSLANENSLQLEKCDDGDFFVRFSDFPVHVSKKHSSPERLNTFVL